MTATVTLTMPRLGETMEEGTVSAWLVAEGQRFERGDGLVEFETDKTAVEFPALGSGRLAKALVTPGAVVRLGEPIAEIDLEGGEDWVGRADARTAPADGTATGDADAAVIDLAMPRLGETMEAGTIAGWSLGLGDAFSRGDPILEIATDKTVAEHMAQCAGEIVELLAKRGDVVPVGTAIARIKVAPADAADERTGLDMDAVAAARGDRRVAAELAPRDHPATPGIGRRATPPARRAARRHAIDLGNIEGTGRRGRVELRDVEAVVAAGRGAPADAKSVLAESRWGPARAPRVLLVHGYGGDRLTLDQLGQRLGRAEIACRAIDLPAHGETTAHASTFDDLAAALAAELAAGEPVHVVAHSLGAAAAVRATARERRALSLTLIAPAGIGLAIDGTFVSAMAAPSSIGQVGHLLRRLSPRADRLSPEAVEAVYRTLAAGRLRPLAADFAQGDRQTVDVVPEIAALAEHMPVRVLVGHRDAILDWRDALALSPRVAVHHFAHAGHMPHWDDPAAVCDLIINSTR